LKVTVEYEATFRVSGRLEIDDKKTLLQLREMIANQVNNDANTGQRTIIVNRIEIEDDHVEL
jgi:hypothetical protein